MTKSLIVSVKTGLLASLVLGLLAGACKKSSPPPPPPEPPAAAVEMEQKSTEAPAQPQQPAPMGMENKIETPQALMAKEANDVNKTPVPEAVKEANAPAAPEPNKGDANTPAM